MSTFNILHIIKSLGRGGAEMLLPNTLHYHDKNKFHFHCVYFLPWKNQMVDTLQNEGSVVKCFPANNNLQLLLRVNEVKKYIKENEIDLVHAHLPWAGIVGSLAGKWAKVPVIYTEHNNVNRYHFLTRFLNKQAYRRYTKVISVSNDCYQAAIAQFNNSAPLELRTILNGVDTEIYTPDLLIRITKRTELGIDPETLVVTNVSQFREQKRLDRWLSIVKNFSNTVPSARFILVGFGPKQEMVDEVVKSYHLEDKLIRPGLQENIKDWLAITDIFLMSSDWEGLPIALLEAMSMGCVPVVTDAGGIPEVMTAQCGFVYPKDNEKVAVEALQKLYDNPELRKKMSIASRNRVIEQFSVKRMVREVEGLYEEVLSCRH